MGFKCCEICKEAETCTSICPELTLYGKCMRMGCYLTDSECFRPIMPPEPDPRQIELTKWIKYDEDE